MIEFSWKVFSQTGNIETYLLMKELETVYDENTSYDMNEDFNEMDQQI